MQDQRELVEDQGRTHAEQNPARWIITPWRGAARAREAAEQQQDHPGTMWCTWTLPVEMLLKGPRPERISRVIILVVMIVRTESHQGEEQRLPPRAHDRLKVPVDHRFTSAAKSRTPM